MRPEVQCGRGGRREQAESGQHLVVGDRQAQRLDIIHEAVLLLFIVHSMPTVRPGARREVQVSS